MRAAGALGLLAILLFLEAGCSEPPAPPPLDRLERLADAVLAEGLAASWEGRTARPFGLAPLLTMSRAELAALESAGEVARVRALRDRVVQLQLSADAELVSRLRVLTELRGRFLLGDQVSLERVLTEAEEASVRRSAWMAQAEAARALAPALRSVAERRVALARERFGRAFLELVDEHRGYDAEVARRLREQVRTALAPAPGSALIDPWDVEASDPALVRRLGRRLDAGGCLPRAVAALRWLGLGTDAPGLRLVAGSDPAGFADFATYAVDPPRDLRVRVDPGAGLFANWATLHELGHAAEGLLVEEAARPPSNRTLSDAVSESCGKLLERLSFAPEWLRRQGVPEADVEATGVFERASERGRMRGILVDTAFEDVLYGGGDRDFDRTHARLLAELAGVRAVPGAPAWALHRTVAVEPRGRFDYLLARCAQAAIYRRLRDLPGGLLGSESARVLREEVVGAAAGTRFEDWFERAAGVPPSCEAWLEDVAGLR